MAQREDHPPHNATTASSSTTTASTGTAMDATLTPADRNRYRRVLRKVRKKIMRFSPEERAARERQMREYLRRYSETYGDTTIADTHMAAASSSRAASSTDTHMANVAIAPSSSSDTPHLLQKALEVRKQLMQLPPQERDALQRKVYLALQRIEHSSTGAPMSVDSLPSIEVAALSPRSQQERQEERRKNEAEEWAKGVLR